MSPLIYLPKNGGAGEPILKLVAEVFGTENATICRTEMSLLKHLRQPFPEQRLAVFIMPAAKHLTSLADFEDLLKNLRLVLIVPDRQKETLITAHRFGPRFISSLEDDFDALAAVLRKMMWGESSYSRLNDGADTPVYAHEKPEMNSY